MVLIKVPFYFVIIVKKRKGIIHCMNATLQEKKVKGLTKSKKELMKKFVGKSSSKVDLNKVREDWKYGNN